MTIERLSLPNGAKIDLENVAGDLLRIAEENADRFEKLQPGTYSLTPDWWRLNTHEHRLNVYLNGTGAYEAIPKDAGVGMSDVVGGKIGKFEPGGRAILIPQHQRAVVIAGPLKNRENHGIYELIVWTPNLPAR